MILGECHRFMSPVWTKGLEAETSHLWHWSFSYHLMTLILYCQTVLLIINQLSNIISTENCFKLTGQSGGVKLKEAKAIRLLYFRLWTLDMIFSFFFWREMVRMWEDKASAPPARCSDATAFSDFKGSLPSTPGDCSGAWQWAARSPLVKNKSSRLSHVATRSQTSRDELIFTANRLEPITIITDVCVHRQASDGSS